MRTGTTARRAYSAAALVEYLTSQSEYVTDGTPTRGRRYINGIHVTDVNDARTIRRWRTFAGVTPKAAERMLATYGLTVAGFCAWSRAHGSEPVLRGQLPTE